MKCVIVKRFLYTRFSCFTTTFISLVIVNYVTVDVLSIDCVKCSFCLKLGTFVSLRIFIEFSPVVFWIHLYQNFTEHAIL